MAFGFMHIRSYADACMHSHVQCAWLPGLDSKKVWQSHANAIHASPLAQPWRIHQSRQVPTHALPGPCLTCSSLALQALAAEKERIAKEKELETARLRALQERAADKQSELDELRARRYQEAKEREWRAKERAQVRAEVYLAGAGL